MVNLNLWDVDPTPGAVAVIASGIPLQQRDRD
jgi:hypothetical protein